MPDNANFQEVLYAEDNIDVTKASCMEQNLALVEESSNKFGLKLNRGRCKVKTCWKPICKIQERQKHEKGWLGRVFGSFIEINSSHGGITRHNNNKERGGDMDKNETVSEEKHSIQKEIITDARSIC